MENYPLLFTHHSPACYHSDDQFDTMMMMSTDHQFFGGPHTINTQNGLFELRDEEAKQLQASSSDGQRAPEIDQPFAGPESKAKPKPKKVRRQRYAFQTRSHVDILDDGYRWRKYGQKAVKNNKFPRSYYRCTRQGCNVKKQVQRLSKDEAVVVTTYEGSHTHPIERANDNFEHILNQMQIYSGF